MHPYRLAFAIAFAALALPGHADEHRQYSDDAHLFLAAAAKALAIGDSGPVASQPDMTDTAFQEIVRRAIAAAEASRTYTTAQK